MRRCVGCRGLEWRDQDVPLVPDRPFGLSIGIAVYDPASSETLEALVERADAAMYDAKSCRGMSCYALAAEEGVG